MKMAQFIYFNCVRYRIALHAKQYYSVKTVFAMNKMKYTLNAVKIK